MVLDPREDPYKIWAHSDDFSFFSNDKWPINFDKSYVFPYLEKGSNYLIKEFPNEKTYQDSKEKIKEL